MRALFTNGHPGVKADTGSLAKTAQYLLLFMQLQAQTGWLLNCSDSVPKANP
jgi:hypothetical protein